LARLDDLIGEVQTQVRSLARQRGKAERYGKMIEERFGIALTLVRRELEDLDIALGRLGQRAGDLAAALPAERTRLAEAERERDLGTVQRELEGRSTLEQESRDGLVAQRTAVRELEEDLQQRAEAFRALEGERAALERERGELGQQLAQASGERAARAEAEWAATAQVTARAREAAARALAAGQAAEGLE